MTHQGKAGFLVRSAYARREFEVGIMVLRHVDLYRDALSCMERGGR